MAEAKKLSTPLTDEDIKGLNITFVTTAKTDGEAKELLNSFNMPFRKK